VTLTLPAKSTAPAIPPRPVFRDDWKVTHRPKTRDRRIQRQRLGELDGGTNVVVKPQLDSRHRAATVDDCDRRDACCALLNVTITQNIIADIGRYDAGENGCTATLYKPRPRYLRDLGPNNVLSLNNIFYRTERGWAIQIYNGSSTNISILNNTFIWSDARSGAAAGHIVVAASVSNLLIENNISYQPNRWLVNTMSGSVTGTIANNIIYGTSSVTSSASSGFSLTITGNMVNTDPKLVSVAVRSWTTLRYQMPT